MRPSNGGACLGYHDHYVVDEGKARIILTVLVTPAEVQDNQPALDLLWRTRFRWKLRPESVTADTKYDTIKNIVAIEDQAIRAYVPLSEAGRRPSLFADTDFIYDAVADIYHCPGEATLRFISRCDRTKRRVYEAPASACRGRRVGRVSMRTISTGGAPTTRRRPTPRRCASARSGWNRASPKPRTGTACAASDCGERRRSTSKPT